MLELTKYKHKIENIVFLKQSQIKCQMTLVRKYQTKA